MVASPPFTLYRRPGVPLRLFTLLLLCATLAYRAAAQQPAEPRDITPIAGDAYYLLDQASGLQADLNGGSIKAGDYLVQQGASYSSLSQRWAFTHLADGAWKISNLLNQMCLDASGSGVVQNPCSDNTASQEWSLQPTSNGYSTLQNSGSGMVLDVSQGSLSAGAQLVQTALGSSPAQSQQWLLRPAFFRGVDNALLEKQEAARVGQNLTWWKDAGTAADLLQIFKNHGINMVRLRPASSPPYASIPPASCSGNNLCYAETDSQDLDLAKRAKNLGMSIELTLLFDGGSSTSMPSSWASDSFAQLQTDLYNYVFQEIESYRTAGVMPDLVAIGNEVDTGFLDGNDPGANFSNFAALETRAIQAVRAAAADTSIGPALPPPLVCIHITPAWDLTNFFTKANSASIPYDAICQSYYPIYHGPLNAAQAAASNPGGKPIEQSVLDNAASSISKPIFIIETGEHYENGFNGDDPWYSPSIAAQREFLIDLNSVLRALPNNLAMGMEYWDAAGVNIPNPSGGFLNGDNQPNAIYVWNGLTLFNNNDSSGTTNVSDPYSELLPAADGLGGRFDPSLAYLLVNSSNSGVLESQEGSTASGASLDTAAIAGNSSASQRWFILANGDGYFRITNANSPSSGPPNVLDDSGASSSAGAPIVQAAATGSKEQEWDVVSAGAGLFYIVNRSSGLVLDLNSSGLAIQQTQSTSATQQWRIIPARLTAASSPSFAVIAEPSAVTVTQGGQGSATLTLMPSGGYSGTASFSCAGLPTSATCQFSPASIVFDGKNTPESTNISVMTQGAGAVPVLREPRVPARRWASFALFALLLVLMLLASRDRSQPGNLRHAAPVLIAALGLFLAGCGGGSGGGMQPPPGPTPTPLGTSVITVTVSATGGSGSPNHSGSAAILLSVTQ